jgi:hypothetical protein
MQSKGILGPQVPFGGEYWSKEIIDVIDFRLIKAREKKVYVRGIVDYVDIFRQKRWTEFCLTQSDSPDTNWTLLIPCGDHNDAN